MRKKNYKGAKCTKRYVNKCDDVCKTYDAIQYAYANLLSEAEEVKSFQVNVDIVSENYKKIMCFHDIMQKKLDILNSIRAEEEKVNGDYAMWQIELMDQKLMAQVTRAAIDSMGELKECLSYEDGKLVADKRILFLLSYQMFQRQYFFSTRELKKELEQRMGLPVDIIENNTKNVRPGKMSIDEIWFGLTDEIRKSVACDDDYFDSLMYEHYSVYVRTPDGNEMVMVTSQYEDQVTMNQTKQRKLLVSNVSSVMLRMRLMC